MPANASIGIELLLSNESEFRADLQRVAETIAQMFGGAVFEKFTAENKQAFSAATKAAEDFATKSKASAASMATAMAASGAEAAKGIVDPMTRAHKLLADQEKKYQDLRAQYAREGTEALLDDLKHLEDETAKINGAIKNAADKETKDILKGKKDAIQEETRLMRQLAKDTEEVQHQGAGARSGLLGVGRNLLIGGGEFTAELNKLKAEAKKTSAEIEEAKKKETEALVSLRKAQVDREKGLITEAEYTEIESMKRLEAAEAKADQQELANFKQKIDKEIAETKEKNEQSAEKSEGGILKGITGSMGGLGGLAAVGGVSAAAGMLFEKGTEMKEREEEIATGLRSMGMNAEEAEKALGDVKKSSSEVSSELALNHVEVEKATAAYLKMGGTTDNLKEKQEDIAALSKKAGVDMEQAAKMYAKAGDPEVAGNLKKFGIVLDANMTSAERSAKIHEKLAGTLDGMKEAADGPLGSFEKMKDTTETLMETLGGLIFTLLSPLFDILGAVANVIKDYLLPPIQKLSEWIGVVLKGAFSVIIGIVKTYISILITLGSWLLKAVEWIGNVTGITQFLVAAFHAVSDAVASAIEWIKGAVETVKNFGSSLLSMIGITDKSSEADEKAKKAIEEKTEALKKAKEATDSAAKAVEDYTESIRKQQDEANKGAKQGQDDAIAAIQDIDAKLKNPALRLAGDTEESLRATRQKWVEHGREMVKIQEQQDKAHHSAAVEIGAASDDEKTKKASTHTAKVAAKTYAEKIAQFLADEKNAVALGADMGGKSDAESLEAIKKRLQQKDALQAADQAKQIAAANHNYQAKLKAAGDNAEKIEEIEDEHEAALAAISDKSTSDRLKGNAELQKAAFELEKKIAIDNFKAKETEIQTLAAQGALTKEEAKKKTEEAEKNHLAILLDLDKKYNIDAAQDKLAAAQLEEKIRNDQIEAEKKRAESRKKTLDSLHQYEEGATKAHDKFIEGEIDDATEKQLQTIRDKALEEAQTEIDKYDKIKDALKQELDYELTNTELTEDAKLALKAEFAEKENELAAEHAQQLSDIRIGAAKQTENTLRAEQLKTVEQYSGPVMQGWDVAVGLLNKTFFDPVRQKWFDQKTVAGQAMTAITTSIIQAVEQWIAKQAVMLVASLLFNTTAAAASSAAMTAVSAAATPAATLMSIATLGAADATGIAALGGALAAAQGMTAAFKFADGGVVSSPIFSPLMKGGAVAGEAGPEAIIPLAKLPGILHASMGGGHAMDLSPVVNKLHAMEKTLSDHLANQTHAIKNTPPIVMDQYANVLSQKQAVVANDLTY